MTYDELYNQVKPLVEEKDWKKNKGTFSQLFESHDNDVVRVYNDLETFVESKKQMGYDMNVIVEALDQILYVLKGTDSEDDSGYGMDSYR